MTRRILTLAFSVLCFASSVGAGNPPGEAALALSARDATLQWGPCPDFMPEGCELAVLHGNPAEPNADVFLKVPGGSRIAHHWHTSAERMVLVSGAMEVAYDGQAHVTLEPGMYAYGPAKLGHEARCTSSEACVLFIAFEAAVDATATQRSSKRD